MGFRFVVLMLAEMKDDIEVIESHEITENDWRVLIGL